MSSTPFWEWSWNVESVIALAALALSVAAWVHTLVVSRRRLRVWIKEYGVQSCLDGKSLLLVSASLTNSSEKPIGIQDIAVQIGRYRYAVESEPVLENVVLHNGSPVLFGTLSLRVTSLPLNLEPYQAMDFFFAARIDAAMTPPDHKRAKLRFRTSRRTAECRLRFLDSEQVPATTLAQKYGLIIAPPSERRY